MESTVSSFPRAVELEQRVAWDGTPPEAGACELSTARLKELRGIGHKLVGFLSARGRWWQHAARARPADAPVWAGGLSAVRPGEIREEGFFACCLVLGREGFHLRHLALPGQIAGRLGELWQRIDPEAPKSLRPIANVPQDADAPLWLALLRLKPLREFWERELRRATVDSLLGLLPDAWVLDPEAVPAGAVIPRLDLASWSELRECRAAGRAFAIARAQSWTDARVLDESLPEEAWSSVTKEALEAFAEEPRVLVDLTDNAGATDPLIVTFYECKGGRVESLGAMGLVPGPDGRLLAARVTAE